MGEFGGQNAHSTLNTDCESGVRIEITCIFERVLLLHVDTCSTTPFPTQPVLQTTTLTPAPAIYNPGFVFVLIIIIPSIFV